MEYRLMLSASTGPIMQDAGFVSAVPAQTMQTDSALLSTAADAVNAKVLHDFVSLANANVQFVSAANGIALFEVASVTGREIQLWKSNGTIAGTTLLHDFGMPVTVQGPILQLTATGNLNGITFFQVEDLNTYDIQLWRTNGTAAGTTLLSDFGSRTGLRTLLADAGHPAGIEIFSLMDFYVGPLNTTNEPSQRNQLWGSNGTAAGTKMLRDFAKEFGTTRNGGFGSGGASGGGNSSRGETTNTGVSYNLLSIQLTGTKTANGTELFIVAMSKVGNGPIVTDFQLWGSNGTASGTRLLHDFGQNEYVIPLAGLYPSQLNGLNPYQSLILGDGTQSFQVTNRITHDAQLWTTNGTPAGTTAVHDFGRGNIDIFYAGTSNGTEVFSVLYADTRLTQLWGSNGTAAGTKLIRNFGPAAVVITPFSIVNGILMLVVTDYTTNKIQLWRSNGRTNGTYSLADLSTGINLSSFNVDLNVYFVDVSDGKLLFFTKNRSAQETRLWGSNGSISGTSLLHDFVGGGITISTFAKVNQGEILEISNWSQTNNQLWTTNGTTSGTTMLHNFGSATMRFDALGGSNSAEFFAVTNTKTNDLQLWSSSGKPSGTKLLYDFGSDGISVTSLGTANGRALFAVNGKSQVDVNGFIKHETQIWITR